MNSAIIIGGNGLIGRALTQQLVLQGVPTLVIGKSKSVHEDLENLLDNGLDYLQVKPFDINIEETANRIKAASTFSEGAVMFFLAWRGENSLADGPLLTQLTNVTVSCTYIKIAKKVFAKKFVSTGSFEELAFERRTKGNTWHTIPKSTDFNWYGFAKTVARRQISFEAYVQKVDFCHTYISIVIDKTLRTQKFVEQSLRLIYGSNKIPIVNNKELCNIASSEEIARQLVSIGENGVNKSIFALGTGESMPLSAYLTLFHQICQKNPLKIEQLKVPNDATFLTQTDFDINPLTTETAYQTNERPERLFREIINSL
jgi:nucleoside-diphosphate-sugar epimerase